MQIKEILKVALKKLPDSSTPNLDARILLAYCAGISQEQLLLQYNDHIDKKTISCFFELIERRSKHEPIAYLVGKQEFYGLEFEVNNNVLIPRPDTELLVETVISDCHSLSANNYIDILDLGTGSGAIAIALAKNLPKARITATDISLNALEIAKKNSNKHNVESQIQFLQGNWFLAIKGADKKFDYIVSNPPYIAENEKNFMTSSTLYEPKISLFAEDKGLNAYIKIIEMASNYLKQGAKLVLEIGFLQNAQVVTLLTQAGYNSIKMVKDLSGHNRTVIACK
ncbi:MAG: peptide chain release factor N(5)-glutamine methyltransferase [Rickettsiales bacterium]|nr:peptide chain release factor N(5)-glutamine methyltransferase [Rickettsiales bacterium]MCA0254528.1 peptide chain release factor N(5)-glutamine methyltransferase [Pseudomonadota bacterium]